MTLISKKMVSGQGYIWEGNRDWGYRWGAGLKIRIDGVKEA